MADRGSTRLMQQAVGAELQAIRDRLGMSRDAAVARFRRYTGETLGARTLVGYETGARSIPTARLMQLALVYGVPAHLIWQKAETRVREPVCRACGRP